MENSDTREDGDSRQGIQSVELSMLVLKAIEQNRGPMSLTAIANASKMGASKVHRYLVSLTRIGLISQSKRTGMYDFGPALRRLGVESLRRTDEVGVACEHLPELRDRIGHAVNLAVWSEHGPVLVRWEYGASTLPITVRVGATLPLTSTSIGRTFLAVLPKTLTDPLVKAELRQEGRGSMTEAELAEVIRKVRENAAAETSGAVIPGLSSIAVPVFSSSDSLPMVMAAAIPSKEFTPKVCERVRLELLATAREISEELGYVATTEKVA